MAQIGPFPPGVELTAQPAQAWLDKFIKFVNNIAVLSWASITGKPTTFAGFGIATNSADLAAVLSDETGTGAAVFANAPALIAPTVSGTGLLHSSTTNLTNGAGAALGTLVNAPVVGPPTKWVPVNDNGTTRYVPMW